MLSMLHAFKSDFSFVGMCWQSCPEGHEKVGLGALIAAHQRFCGKRDKEIRFLISCQNLAT